MAEQNQKEAEFFAIAATGRKGLEDMADRMGGELMSIAAKSVREAGSTWIQRAVVSIANDDSLRDVLQTKAGLFSVYKALAKAATMGLQIGGQFKQAHLVPYNGKVDLIVDVNGYKQAAINGPGAVLSSVEIARVYEGEQVRIDKGKATVDHVIDPTKERGKLIGVYGVITRTDGSRVVEYMTRTEALRIRDAHSMAYKKGLGPWKSDEDAMVEKTAAKAFLRRYAAEAEGLAMLYGQDMDGDDQAEQAPPPRNVSDRMSAHLDRTADRVKPAAKKPEPEQAIQGEAEVLGSTDAVEPESEKKTGEPIQGDIF